MREEDKSQIYVQDLVQHQVILEVQKEKELDHLVKEAQSLLYQTLAKNK